MDLASYSKAIRTFLVYSIAGGSSNQSYFDSLGTAGALSILLTIYFWTGLSFNKFSRFS